MATPPLLLVVDDQVDLLEMIGFRLKGKGFSVELVSERLKAVEMALKGDYALILMDVRMPGLPLVDAVSRLRVDRPTLPILLMTAGCDASVLEASRALGALGPVAKPIDFKALASEILGIIGVRA